jgi:hypothetical protein
MAVRHSLSAFALVGVIGMVGTAAAEKDKPRIAVLGLEAGLETGGVVDQATTKVARTLTNGLRSHAASARSVYTLAPSSNKELIDEKLMKSCDSEKPECMTPIAKEVNAEFLLFGRVDKTTENGAPGYRVTLKLLDVGKGKEQKPWQKFVAAGEATAAWAEEVYATVTGEPRELVMPVKKKPAGDSKLAWKATAVVTGAAALVLGGTFVYAWRNLETAKEQTNGGRDCPATGGPKACDDGDRYSSMSKYAGYSALAAGGISLIAIYKSTRSSSSSEKERPAQAGKTPKRTFVVTPVVAPDGGGATVRIDW